MDIIYDNNLQELGYLVKLLVMGISKYVYIFIISCYVKKIYI